MKIAVLSDIHGNCFALKEVLDYAETIGVKRLFVLGDLVGYYYYPEVVLNLLNEWEFSFIRGNHEKMLAAAIGGEICLDLIKAKYGSGLEMAINKLSKKEIDFIINQPDVKKIEIKGVKFLLCHGSPWKSNEYLYPDTKMDTLLKCEKHDVDFVLTGHSHHSFCFSSGRTVLINSGSVGQSRRQGGFADWVVIDDENKVFRQMCTPYDTRPLIKDVEKHDPQHEYLRSILKRKA